MSTPSTNIGSNGPGSRDPETIERAIDETRSDVGETLDALQARLSPGQLLDRAMELVRDNGGQFAGNLGRTVRDNPFPVILTGVGLVWMMATSMVATSRTSAAGGTRTGGWSGRSDEDMSERITEGYGDMSERVTEAASDAANTAGNRISAAAQSATDAASSAASRVSQGFASASDTVMDQSRRLSDGLARLLREQPLLVGAVGIAVGAVLGYALPPSDAEDRLLGGTRDAAVRRATESAHAVAAKANETVREATRDESLRAGESADPQQSTPADHEAQGVSDRT